MFCMVHPLFLCSKIKKKISIKIENRYSISWYEDTSFILISYILHLIGYETFRFFGCFAEAMFPPNQTRITATVTECGQPWHPERNLYFGVQGNQCIRSIAFARGFNGTDDDSFSQFDTDRCVPVHNVDGSVSGITGRVGNPGPGYIAVYKRKRKSFAFDWSNPSLLIGRILRFWMVGFFAFDWSNASLLIGRILRIISK